jgi:hypothetical protein
MSASKYAVGNDNRGKVSIGAVLMMTSRDVINER